MGLEDMIKFTDEVLKFIIDEYTVEPGVRKLKEILFEIVDLSTALETGLGFGIFSCIPAPLEFFLPLLFLTSRFLVQLQYQAS